jgi:hypothetical protein
MLSMRESSEYITPGVGTVGNASRCVGLKVYMWVWVLCGSLFMFSKLRPTKTCVAIANVR